MASIFGIWGLYHWTTNENQKKLLNVMNNSLNQILKAIKGLVVMSESLEKMFNSLFDNQVPDMWSKVAYPSLKPLGSWVKDLIERCKFIGGWIKDGNPAVYWISGFFFPQAFITGTLQNYARKVQISIHTISFDFAVIPGELDAWERIKEKPEDGCYIRGLYLEAAIWDCEKGVVSKLNRDGEKWAVRTKFSLSFNLGRPLSQDYRSTKVRILI